MSRHNQYQKAIELLRQCSTPEGFLASAQDVSNYKRVWARDGVICGLAALASGDEQLIETFKNTLQTLAKNQHQIGTIPSNVSLNHEKSGVSYGGLAGRVDAVTWFIIGVCQYAYYTKDITFVAQLHSEIQKCLQLLDSWEFNNRHLIYVPLSGNWADEYITDGYVLYDQLLRIWALKSYNHFANNKSISNKIEKIKEQIIINFTPNLIGEKYHDRAYHQANIQKFMPCSFSPAGYKSQFDAFGNSLAVFLNLGTDDFQNSIIGYAEAIKESTDLKLIPAFWPPIQKHEVDWHLLKNNCKYEFRNHPYEFHNGGSWPMVNGFYGLALLKSGKINEALQLLDAINRANSVEDDGFYENFNTQTSQPNGVKWCAWSAAATILLHQSCTSNFKLLV